MSSATALRGSLSTTENSDRSSFVSISGASLHIRFTQAIDIGRLGHAVVVMQGSRVVQGVLVPDPDGMGLTFIGVAGVWADGEYTLLLRSAVDGLANVDGQWLDGDYDGHAGGDFRATFNVHGGATRFGAMLVGLGGVVSLLHAAPRCPLRHGQPARNEPASLRASLSHGTVTLKLSDRIARRA